MTDNNLKYTLDNRFDSSCLIGPITPGPFILPVISPT